MEFQREIISEKLIDEFSPLLKKHWEEIAFFKDIAFKPDRKMYLKLEEIGNIRCFSARNENQLIGYAIFFLGSHPHSEGLKIANQDAIYIDPLYRGGSGYRFIKWCDHELRKDLVEIVYHGTKVAHNLGRLFERAEYGLIDHVYGRRL